MYSTVQGIPTILFIYIGTSMYFGTFQAIKSVLLATAGDRPYDRQVVLFEKAQELKTSLGRNPFVSLHIDEDAADDVTSALTLMDANPLRERRFVHVHYTLSDSAHLITGGCARTLVGTLFMPITVMKVRLESSQYQYKSIFDACSSIHREDGFKGQFDITVILT